MPHVVATFASGDANSSNGQSPAEVSAPLCMMEMAAGRYAAKPRSELLQEAQVIPPEISDVFDTIAGHGAALWPHAKGIAGKDGWVIAPILQHHRVHHTAAQDLEPAGMLAHTATPAIAQNALHIHLSGWLGEGEVAGPEARLATAPEHALGEIGQCSFQVGETDVVAHSQPLDLIELYLAAGSELFVSVAHARQDDTDWFRAVFAHSVDLAGRGMGAQQHVTLGGVEGVLHIAGRMVPGEVEQLEVAFVSLHIPAAIDLEAHVSPDLGNAAQYLGAGMQPPVRR